MPSVAGLKPRLPSLLGAIAIAIAGCWVFAPVWHAGWLWDDDSYVTGNLFLRTSGGLWNIWTHPAGLLNYFPLKDTVQWLQWHAWGDRPLGYHLTNVALHVGSSLLLWRLLGKFGVPQAWLGGLLFAVHPVAVESVAWVSELKNTLSLPAVLLALSAYVDYDTAGRRSAYLRAVLWFLAAMLCKSTVALFPFALLLYAGWKRGRIRLADVRASAVFFAIALALGLVTVWFEHHRAMLGFDDGPARGRLARAAATGVSLAFYFCSGVWPARLLPTYPRWVVSPAAVAPYLPWVLLLAAAAWARARRTAGVRHVAFGLGWFLLNLAPVLGFVPMAYQRIAWVADHFAYLSLAGLTGLAAAAFSGAVHRAGPRRLALAWTLAAGTAVALAWQSHAYAAVFASRRTLWSYTLQRNPDSWSAYNDLGNLSLVDGHPQAAIPDFERALRLEPDAVGAHNNLATAYGRVGRLEDAVRQYEECLALGADYFEIQSNLAAVLARTGRSAEAITHYRRALELNPKSPGTHLNAGALLASLGRLPEAVAHFEQAVSLGPEDPAAHANLGSALAQLGRFPEAIAQYQEVQQLKADYPDLQFNLGNALLETNRVAEAAAAYARALQARPRDPEAHYNLGLALRALGRSPEAQLQFEQAEALRTHP